MVWRRLFRGRSSTTTTVDDSAGAAPGEDAGDDGGTREGGGETQAAGEHEVVTPRARGGAPRFGGFSFEVPAAPGSAAPVEARREVGRETVGGASTLVSPVSPPSSPTADMVAAVRRKAGRRGARVADRGVAPVWVPSLREQATLYRLAAEGRAADAPETTLALWDAYLELCPADADGWFLYGQCALASGRVEAAEEAFVEARRRAPTNGLAAAALGYIASTRGRAVEAVRLYEVAVALEPDDVELLEALAAAHDAAGQLGEAAAVRAQIGDLTRES